MKIQNLYRRIRAKLGSKSGESISETMVSVLISALALVMLAGAVSTASHVITESKDKLSSYYDNNEKIVTMQTGGESGHEIEIKPKDGSTPWAKVPVTCYINDTFSSDPVITYKYKKTS